MDRVARGFFGIAVLISLIQTLHAVTEDEYHEKSTAIKSRPEIKEFLKENGFVISQYGVFFDKLADIFSHVRKTKVGKDMMEHVWNETETVLKEKRTYGFIASILDGVRKVLTSEVGRNNLFAVARFIQDELQIPKLFNMCLSLKKIVFHILFSEDGLDALVKLKENGWVLEHKKDTSELLEIMDADFPILSVPTKFLEGDSQVEQQPADQMKSILDKMQSMNQQ